MLNTGPWKVAWTPLTLIHGWILFLVVWLPTHQGRSSGTVCDHSSWILPSLAIHSSRLGPTHIFLNIIFSKSQHNNDWTQNYTDDRMMSKSTATVWPKTVKLGFSRARGCNWRLFGGRLAYIMLKMKLQTRSHLTHHTFYLTCKQVANKPEQKETVCLSKLPLTMRSTSSNLFWPTSPQNILPLPSWVTGSPRSMEQRHMLRTP